MGPYRILVGRMASSYFRRPRRQFLRGSLILASGLLWGCGLLPAPAQQPAKVHRVGFLLGASSATTGPVLEVFRNGMRELGYVEGHNFTLETRFAEGQVERSPQLAAELVRLPVDENARLADLGLEDLAGAQENAGHRKGGACYAALGVRLREVARRKGPAATNAG